MRTKELSSRETEIVELAAAGHTNDAIAHQLGLSVGTVNTYWLRIKLKVGGAGRTEVVLNIFKKRAEELLEDQKIDWKGLESILEQRGLLDVLAAKDQDLELRTAQALLHLAMDKLRSVIWATDSEMIIQVIENGEFPATQFGPKWKVGHTIYEIFNTTDPSDPAVAAHIAALAGRESRLRLGGIFEGMLLRVIPVIDEAGESFCCISIMSSANE